ncbi:hypothetical protein MPTK1_3g04420 [Marchantia polymorpha subsp. ruderalis]|uniref:Cytochrome b-c1 complex subunit 8 n=2 Tax=Marchantia polymorpha TaxID=3197 RepID=A0A176WLQ3_MARPO|nr:hypothetical protein AXG93_3005s1150 [Marchantia polymorpha subsp. ruderalis]PTQ43985.1 hypothetical protein MARPO_0022s0089 [Marchantia polymorpha]BBN04419.1 hypothetical protein Mp_3g04420 [Marchantia polymorpha subsp. ruderalis]|eukprot:PTQ43985.1 hypothetical protein MARPO_0022s0089 [Marchantia polymorpha]
MGGKYKLKEVTYSLGPDSWEVMRGLWKGAGYKTHKRIHENWVSALTLLVPVIGSYWYAENYREKEKLHHRH